LLLFKGNPISKISEEFASIIAKCLIDNIHLTKHLDITILDGENSEMTLDDRRLRRFTKRGLMSMDEKIETGLLDMAPEEEAYYLDILINTEEDKFNDEGVKIELEGNDENENENINPSDREYVNGEEVIPNEEAELGYDLSELNIS